jgi:uncharacterized membrane protein YfcA
LNKKLVDTVLLGIAVWAIGYAMGFYIITTPGYPGVMDQPVTLLEASAVIALVTGAITYVRFRKRSSVTWKYALLVGGNWLLVAVVFDFLFIVLLFNASQYYRLHILVYYLLTFIVPTVIVRVTAGSTRTR